MSKKWILAVLLLVFLTTVTVASAQNGAGEITHTPIIKRGVSYLQNAPAAAPLGPMKPPREADRERDLVKAMRRSMRSAAPNTNLERAQASANANVISGGTAVTFNGLDIVDQEFDNRFDLEPPDQGVCAGNGLIIEHINLVLAVYTQSGSRVAGPATSNSFFGVPRDFLSDPRCYFDPGTSRWFMTIIDVASVDIIIPGLQQGRSFLLGAVSFDANPLDGFALFAIDVTDDGLDGTPSHPGCAIDIGGCFGDQPLLGADDNGIYISTNEFGVAISNLTFNGAQIYAISKAGLESLSGAQIIPPGVHLANLPLAEGIAASVQPATSPTVGGEPNKGTEYFMSSLNFIGASDNRIAVWALTNTSSLNAASPNLKLQHLILKTKVYEEPFGAQQKKGPTPLGTLLGDPEETLSPDDNRMQQVVFSGSLLYSAITSTIFDGNEFVNGILYFIVQPSFTSTGKLTAALKIDNYLTVKGENLIYPAIGISDDNQGAMVFTLAGPNFFPSAAFVRVNQNGAQGEVRVAAEGVAPDDGFTGYSGTPSNVQLAGRWGDYSAAVADGEHNIIIATEYISGHRVKPILPNGPGLANWSTSISAVRVSD
jgi:hypothetical protein